MTRTELAGNLRELAESMLDSATNLDFYGGFNNVAKLQSAQLIHASAVMMRWAEKIEGEV